MVRLGNIGGKALRRVQEQAGVNAVIHNHPEGIVGKPVYLYVIQKFPERRINLASTTSHNAQLQLNTLILLWGDSD